MGRLTDWHPLIWQTRPPPAGLGTNRKEKASELGRGQGMLAMIEVLASEKLIDIQTDHLGRPVADE